MIRNWTSRVARDLCAEVGETDPEIAIQSLISQRLSGIGGKTIPVDLNEIIEELGIEGIRIEDCPGAGYLFDNGTNCWICVNRRDADQRQRFTAAHELIHFLLPRYTPGTYRPTKTGQFRRDHEEEYLCDLGASYILMPPDSFDAIMEGNVVSATRIACVAEHFDVSLEAAIVTSCTRIEAAFLVVKWQPNGDGFMLVESVYRSKHIGRDFWLDADTIVSPTHLIAQVSMSAFRKSQNSEFCLKYKGRKIYMRANHLSLGRPGSAVLSVLYPNSREKWTPI